MVFTRVERDYLHSQFLGRLATVGPHETPQVRPLGFRLNADDTIDLGGPNVAATQRYRNVRTYPRVAFVVDDMTPEDPGEIRPGWGRGIEIRGHAETLTVDDPPGGNSPMAGRDIIRIHPRRVLSWHLDPDNPDGATRDVDPGTAP
ncbi:PPOX class F420-dependent oxidoreductase [Saccharomonospora iraqiensis]|uniref:PPOX class F420-dependent oxidoreductase n=1 Tax=Saccharomonospora iraqiensis TaxID=52698 RepID=UPI00022E007C|nr:PPOX class F420-dependent oxidoreductase [Saccharomonospora iraqiensis]